MPYQPVLGPADPGGPDSPNSGCEKWNANDTELYGRLETIESGGLILPSALPSLATTETHVVADEAAMLTLAAQRGDVAVRTDLDPERSYILSGEDPTILANWTQITFAGAAGMTQQDADARYVRTVNGTGPDANGDVMVASSGGGGHRALVTLGSDVTTSTATLEDIAGLSFISGKEQKQTKQSAPGKPGALLLEERCFEKIAHLLNIVCWLRGR